MSVVRSAVMAAGLVCFVGCGRHVGSAGKDAGGGGAADAASSSDGPAGADLVTSTEGGAPDVGAPDVGQPQGDASQGGASDADASDAGASDAGAIFPGCDPAALDCPDPGHAVCSVQCGTRTAMCRTTTIGGRFASGSSCETDLDCGDGARCVDYTDAGCALKRCRQFCRPDTKCDQPFSGMGTNVCAVPLSCPGAATGYRLCTLSCDPSWKAHSQGATTCGPVLSCLLVDPVHADCACAPATRVKTEGAACSSSAECAPGAACFGAGAAQRCRPLCLCNASGSSCLGGPGDDCPTVGTHCAPIADGQRYGVCLPN